MERHCKFVFIRFVLILVSSIDVRRPHLKKLQTQTSPEQYSFSPRSLHSSPTFKSLSSPQDSPHTTSTVKKRSLDDLYQQSPTPKLLQARLKPPPSNTKKPFRNLLFETAARPITPKPMSPFSQTLSHKEPGLLKDIMLRKFGKPRRREEEEEEDVGASPMPRVMDRGEQQVSPERWRPKVETLDAYADSHSPTRELQRVTSATGNGHRSPSPIFESFKVRSQILQSPQHSPVRPLAFSSTVAAVPTKETTAPLLKKRGRGRPRKYPRPSTSPKSSPLAKPIASEDQGWSLVSSTPSSRRSKGRRGSGRRSVPGSVDSKSGTLKKRKRGRPRKYPRPEEQGISSTPVSGVSTAGTLTDGSTVGDGIALAEEVAEDSIVVNSVVKTDVVGDGIAVSDDNDVAGNDCDIVDEDIVNVDKDCSAIEDDYNNPSDGIISEKATTANEDTDTETTLSNQIDSTKDNQETKEETVDECNQSSTSFNSSHVSTQALHEGSLDQPLKGSTSVTVASPLEDDESDIFVTPKKRNKPLPSSSSTPKVKRGRGRPRKYPRPEPEESKSKQKPSPGKPKQTPEKPTQAPDEPKPKQTANPSPIQEPTVIQVQDWYPYFELPSSFHLHGVSFSGSVVDIEILGRPSRTSVSSVTKDTVYELDLQSLDEGKALEYFGPKCIAKIRKGLPGRWRKLLQQSMVKHESSSSEESEEEIVPVVTERRRSGRMHIAPLQFWKNERVLDGKIICRDDDEEDGVPDEYPTVPRKKKSSSSNPSTTSKKQSKSKPSVDTAAAPPDKLKQRLKRRSLTKSSKLSKKHKRSD